MRNVIVVFVLLALILPASAAAQGPLAPPGEDRTARVDTLLQELKRSGNDTAAARLAERIQRNWAQSGSASIDLMMQWSADAMQAGKFDVALDFLDQIVILEPDFAEGWNRRATVHFMMENYAKSMADIDRTLRLEPRHFGALAGMAQIMQRTGRKEMALRAYERVLEVYPMMRSAQEELGTLADELAGQGI